MTPEDPRTERTATMGAGTATDHADVVEAPAEDEVTIALTPLQLIALLGVLAGIVYWIARRRASAADDD